MLAAHTAPVVGRSFELPIGFTALHVRLQCCTSCAAQRLMQRGKRQETLYGEGAIEAHAKTDHIPEQRQLSGPPWAIYRRTDTGRYSHSTQILNTQGQ